MARVSRTTVLIILGVILAFFLGSYFFALVEGSDSQDGWAIGYVPSPRSQITLLIEAHPLFTIAIALVGAVGTAIWVLGSKNV